MKVGKFLSQIFLKPSVGRADQTANLLSRPLTDNEKALARRIFGNAINLDVVEVHNDTLYRFGGQDQNRAVAYFNKISFPGTAYSADFAQDKDPIRQSVFVHELVHVWQQQNDVLDVPYEFIMENIHTFFKYQKAYKYKLEPGKDLMDYGFERQAAIIQDYFLLTEFGIAASYKNRHLDGGKMEPGALKAAYESVLANFQHNPAYARGHETKKYTLGNWITKESEIFFAPSYAPTA